MSHKYSVVMPKMSMTMETGELINFHVQVGDQVRSGDVLFEVMTDKIDMEVEAPADGEIEVILELPGAIVEIGKPVLIMLTADKIMAFDFGTTETEREVTAIVTEVPSVVTLNNSSPIEGPIKAVPKARSEALNRGIDLNSVSPSGDHNTIMMADIDSFPQDPAIQKRQNANKALIAKGIEANRGVAQASFNRRVTTNFDLARFISIWAKVLRSRPDLSLNEHIGVALIIESKYGSALPVFKDPDLLSLSELTSLVLETTDSAKHGKVPVAMLSGATSTVFDLTSYSMSSATPLLFPNQYTSITIGLDENNVKIISLTIDLNICDFYDGASLLDALVNSL